MNTEPQLQPSQRNRLQIVPLAIWSGAVFIVIAATILFANDQKNFRLLTEIVLGPPSPVSPGPPAGTSAQSPETVQKRQALLEMPATETIPLVRLGNAEDRCRSLQLTDQHKVATPANWQQGEDVVIVPSLKDEAEIAQRFPKGYKAVTPYLRLTPQPEQG